MISKNDLLETIAECEKNVNSFQDFEKLAALYTVYDHLYGEPLMYADINTEAETIIETNGNSVFLQTVNGKNSQRIWKIMSELMDSVQLIQPKLYDVVMQKINEL